MIRDHVWRSAKPGGKQPATDRLGCAYLGTCGRLREEHERAVAPQHLRRSR